MKDCVEDVCCEIGKVALAWSKIDHLLTFGIAHFSGIAVGRAQCMFVRTSVSGKIDAFGCLLGEHCQIDETFCERMSQLLSDIDHYRSWRNDLMHCDISIKPSGTSVSKSKVKNGKVIVNCKHYSVEQVKEHTLAIESLATELEDLISDASNMDLMAR